MTFGRLSRVIRADGRSIKMKKGTRLYNVIFPWWLIPLAGLFFSPPLGIALAALAALIDWAVDSAVLIVTLKRRGIENRGRIYRAVWWKIWLIGFGADLAGVVFMTLVSVALTSSYSDGSAFGRFLGDSGNAIMYNAFRSPLSFLVVLAAVAGSGIVIYFADRAVLDRAEGISFRESSHAARMLAFITAPWTFFIPTFFF